MAKVPEGKFWRGCGPAEIDQRLCQKDPEAYILINVPYRQIELSEFWIDVHEATRAEWDACVQAGLCAHTAFTTPDPVTPKLPASGVTWDAVRNYCAFRDKRLPTEAEWEKAARGTDGRLYPWGNDLPECDTANMLFPNSWNLPLECNGKGPKPVDAYPKDISPYGVVGMAGNVQEWVNDWAVESYYEEAPTLDPPGPEASDIQPPQRIMRGTYWGADGGAKTFRRWWFAPDDVAPRIGVRCASSVHPDEIDDPLAEP